MWFGKSVSKMASKFVSKSLDLYLLEKFDLILSLEQVEHIIFQLNLILKKKLCVDYRTNILKFQCLVLAASIAVTSAFPFPYPQGGIAIPRPGADGSYGKDQYFQVIYKMY